MHDIDRWVMLHINRHQIMFTQMRFPHFQSMGITQTGDTPCLLQTVLQMVNEWNEFK